MTSNRNISEDQVPRRSWVVAIRGHVPVLEHSRWEVGYTAAHKATASEAIEYAIQQNIQTHKELEAQRQQLLTLLTFAKAADPNA